MKLSDNSFTKEQIEFIKANFDKYSYSELANKFNEKFNTNKTPKSLMSKAYRLGLRKLKDRPNNIRYTKEQEEWLKENASKYFRKELVKRFNKKFNTNANYNQINKKCVKLNARGKTIEDYHKDIGSWNKGLSGEEYKAHFTEESYKNLIDNLNNINKNRRAKPHQIVIRKDRKVYRPFIVLDEEDKKTHKHRLGVIPLARYVYENKIGRLLKPNERVVHLDGDVKNCNVDNLYLVSLETANTLYRRGWHNIPNKQVMKTAIKQCEFEQTIRRVSRERG